MSSGDKEDLVYKAKLAEQAERYDGNINMSIFAVQDDFGFRSRL